MYKICKIQQTDDEELFNGLDLFLKGPSNGMFDGL